jgi:hypothetical protein
MFEILDHGSVIVLAENTAGTSALFYSFDEGDSWNAYSFYSATTMLGRWQTSTGGAVFECYPVYVRARFQAPNGPGFQLTCTGLFTNVVRVCCCKSSPWRCKAFLLSSALLIVWGGGGRGGGGGGRGGGGGGGRGGGGGGGGHALRSLLGVFFFWPPPPPPPPPQPHTHHAPNTHLPRP